MFIFYFFRILSTELDLANSSNATKCEAVKITIMCCSIDILRCVFYLFCKIEKKKMFKFCFVANFNAWIPLSWKHRKQQTNEEKKNEIFVTVAIWSHTHGHVFSGGWNQMSFWHWKSICLFFILAIKTHNEIEEKKNTNRIYIIHAGHCVLRFVHFLM